MAILSLKAVNEDSPRDSLSSVELLLNKKKKKKKLVVYPWNGLQ